MRGRIAVAMGGSIAVVAALLAGVDGHADGMQIFARDGCTCHSDSPSMLATMVLSGYPDAYEGGKRYTFTVSIDGAPALPVATNQGGFAIEATAGRFEPKDDRVQSVGLAASHTEVGNDQREWTLDWVAPTTAGEVTIIAAANAVDGTGTADPLDLWNRVEVTFQGTAAPAGQTIANGTSTNATGSMNAPTNESRETAKTPLPWVAALCAAAIAARVARRR